jgi:hypothetical protein
MRGANDVPSMFERGRSFADTAEGLGTQFGTAPPRTRPVNAALNPDDLGSWYAYQIAADPKSKGLDGARLLGAAQDLRYLQAPSSIPYDSVLSAMQHGLLNKDDAYHIWDTTGLWNNSGQGTKVYASAFGHLLNQGEQDKNITQGLSGVNSLRRSYNQASAIERAPELADRIIAAPSQFSALLPTSNKKRLGEIQRMAPEQQVGALQLAAGASALHAIKEALQRDADILGGRSIGNKAEAAMIKRARQDSQDMIGLAAPRFFGSSSLANTPSSAAEVARAYQTSPFASGFGLGARSLTKLGIVNDALKGASFEDLASRFPGLEYRAGGPVLR